MKDEGGSGCLLLVSVILLYVGIWWAWTHEEYIPRPVPESAESLGWFEISAISFAESADKAAILVTATYSRVGEAEGDVEEFNHTYNGMSDLDVIHLRPDKHYLFLKESGEKVVWLHDRRPVEEVPPWRFDGQDIKEVVITSGEAFVKVKSSGNLLASQRAVSSEGQVLIK